MLKNRNDKYIKTKTYECINEEYTCQDDKIQIDLAWCTYDFINKFNEFTKLCKINFVFMLINSPNLIIFGLFL